MNITLSPTSWAIFGLILLVLEAMVPGIFLLFFGLGALAVALLLVLFPGLGPGAQWLLFAAFSVGSLLCLRRQLARMFTGKRSAIADGLTDDFEGQSAAVTGAIRPGQPGKVEMHGANWEASSDEELAVGTAVAVVGRSGLTLKVKRLS